MSCINRRSYSFPTHVSPCPFPRTTQAISLFVVQTLVQGVAMDEDTLHATEDERWKSAVVASEFARPDLRCCIQDLLLSSTTMCHGGVLEYVDINLLGLTERRRRCLAAFGALGALEQPFFGAGHDPTNTCYASVWEIWKQEMPRRSLPVASTVTNAVSAGNVIEAMLGASWLWRHNATPSAPAQGCLSNEDAFKRMLLQAGWGVYTFDVDSEFIRSIATIGRDLIAWVPVVERACTAYARLQRLCPVLWCTRAAYNAGVQYAHFEAIRLGYPNATPFLDMRIPPLPLQVLDSPRRRYVLAHLERGF